MGSGMAPSTFRALFCCSSPRHQVPSQNERSRTVKLEPTNVSPYRRLDASKNEIRLLHVAAGEEDDEIQCKLQYVSLDDEPNYETISYCWGNATERSTIILDGRIFDAPRSSCEVLRFVRSVSRHLVFWIDAICINQEDLDERSSQVAIMDKIYRSGRENLAYLGNAESEDVAVDAHLAYMRAEVKIQEYLDGMSGEQMRNMHLAISGNKVISQEDADSLEPLFASHWFSRIWIVQESVLSKSTICYWHGRKFSLDSLLLIAEFVTTGVTEGVKFFIKVQEIYALREKRILFGSEEIPRLPLDSFFDLAIAKEASEPRDYVFAWLSMLDKNRILIQPDLLVPDYRKPVARVYQDATRFALLLEDRDTIFHEINHESETDLYDRPLASWSLLWHQVSEVGETPSALPSGYEMHAGGQEPSDARRLLIPNRGSDDVLTIGTFCADTVDWSSRSTWNSATLWYNSKRDDTQVERIFLTVCLAMQKLCAAVGGVEHLIDSLTADVLTAGLIHTGSMGIRGFKDEDHLLECYHACRKYHSVHGKLPNINNNNHAQSPENMFYDTFLNRAYKHQFFTSSKGYVGVGPILTEPGDVVAIFKNGGVPHILRPLGEAYKYVGVAYIPGLMNGEVLEMDIEPEMIDIM